MTQFGLPADQRTMTTEDRIEPIPGMGVCDFCTSIPVVAAYPCGTVVVMTPLGTHASSDAWGACEHCRDLIEADDREGLLQRSLGGFIIQEGEQPAGVLNEVGRWMRATQDAFFEARHGDAEPV